MFTDESNLGEARKFLRDNWEKGTDCPCCGRLVKLYPYKLNANACKSLILIYRISEDTGEDWVHVQNEFSDRYSLKATAMSYIILKHWGFIVSKQPNDDPTKKSSGYWAITAKGKDFIHDRNCTVPSTAMVYKDRAEEFRGDYINIRQAMGVRFDYSELMGEYLSESKQGELPI